MRTSPPFLFLKYWNKNVAATNVIANPINNEEIRLNGLARSVRTDVNCRIGIYNNASTTSRKISDIVRILPLNQLLKSDPASIVAIPIQSRVIVP